MKLAAIALLLIAGVGCASRKPVGPTLVLPGSCIVEARISGCDPTTEPPKCKHTSIRYKHDCGQWVAK